MLATQTLPERYQEAGTIDIKQDQRLLVLFNIAALVLLLIFGWLFLQAAAWLRPGETFSVLGEIQIGSVIDFLVFIAWVLVLSVLYVVAHEAVHGLFFWLFTRAKPVFAFHWNYAYAAAPGWFIRRNPFLVTTLAPLILISAAGLLVIAAGPPGWFLPTWFVITMNAAGAVGDMLVAVWLITKPASALVQDRGDAVTLFMEK